jgi:hypothetical protein
MAVSYEGMPAAIDILYLKVAGTREVLSMPLTEAFEGTKNITYDWRLSTPATFVFNEEVPNGRQFRFPRQEFMLKLAAEIYESKYKITDLAIQAGGETQSPEVTRILG